MLFKQDYTIYFRRPAAVMDELRSNHNAQSSRDGTGEAAREKPMNTLPLNARRFAGSDNESFPVLDAFRTVKLDVTPCRCIDGRTTNALARGLSKLGPARTADRE